MYVLNIEKLMAGDILLTSENITINCSFKNVVKILKSPSVWIRLVTWSKYSHAMIYVGNYSFIHAVANDGVKRLNLQREFYEKESQVCVLRVENETIANMACEYAKLKVGTEYSIKEAVRTKMPFFKEDNRQFCSRLVAESYEKAGLYLVKNSSLCSPKELYKSKKIQIIPNCLRKTTSNDLMIQQSLDIPGLFAFIQADIFEKIRLITKRDIQNIEDILRFLQQNPQFDNQITQLYIDEKYFEFSKSLIYKNYHYSYEALEEYSPSNITKNEFLKEEIQSIKDMQKEAQSAFEFYDKLENERNLKFATMIKEHYHQNLISYKKRLELCEQLKIKLNNDISKE